jgi:hypothetical protein
MPIKLKIIFCFIYSSPIIKKMKILIYMIVNKKKNKFIINNE